MPPELAGPPWWLIVVVFVALFVLVSWPNGEAPAVRIVIRPTWWDHWRALFQRMARANVPAMSGDWCAQVRRSWGSDEGGV